MENNLPFFVECLRNTLSNDDEERTKATGYVTNILTTNALKILEYTTTIILASETQETVLINQSLILIQHIFKPSQAQNRKFLLGKWESLPFEVRDTIKKAVIRGLFYNELSTRQIGAHCLTFIYDLDQRNFSEHVLLSLTDPMLNPSYPIPCTMGCFFALNELYQKKLLYKGLPNFTISTKKICEVFIKLANDQNLLPQNEYIMLVDIFANCFPLFGEFFADPQFRNGLLVLIHQKLSQLQIDIVHNCYYHLLYKFFKFFYDDIMISMEGIFTMSNNSLSCGIPTLIIPCIEFWNKVSKFERKIQKYNLLHRRNERELRKYNGIVEQSFGTLSNILIQLTQTYCNPEPNNDELNEINIHQIAMICFKNISSLCINNSLELIRNYFENNFNSNDWNNRYTSVFIIWALLSDDNEDKSRTLQFIEIHFDAILNMLNDDYIVIQETTILLLKIMIRQYERLRTSDNTLRIIQILKNYLFKSPVILTRTCDFIWEYAQTCKRNHVPAEKEFFNECFELESSIFLKNETIGENILYSVSEALAALIEVTPIEHKKRIIDLLPILIEQINQILIGSNDSLDKNIPYMLIRFRFVLIYAIATYLQSDIRPLGEMVMTCILHCLSIPNTIIHEEAQLALSPVINGMGYDVINYGQNIVSLLLNSQNSQNPTLIVLSSIAFKSLFKALKTQIPYECCQQVIELFGINLHNHILPIKNKLYILDAIGEMIVSMGIAGLQFCDTYMIELNNVQNIPLDHKNKNDIEVAPSIFHNLMHGYKCVIQIAKEDNDYLNRIIANFRQIKCAFDKINNFREVIDENLLEDVLELLNLILNNFAPRVHMHLHSSAIRGILDYCCEFMPELKYKINPTKFMLLNK